MSVDRDDFKQIMSLTEQSTLDICLNAFEEGAVAVASQLFSVINKTAWEVSRPDAYVVKHDVSFRVGELIGDRWYGGEYSSATLSAFYDSTGTVAVVFGWCMKGGERVVGASRQSENDIFDAVQKALDEKIIELDLRHPETNELLTYDSSHNLTGPAVENTMSNVVAKDIDKQVKEFKSELDSIFGSSPTPTWDPPTPRKETE